jgi:hypothetical protein
MSMFSIKKIIFFLSCILLILTIANCSGDSSEIQPVVKTPIITVTGSLSGFNATNELSFSESKSLQVKGTDLTENLEIVTSENFEVSLDNSDFSNQINIPKENSNGENTSIYLRFAPEKNAIGIVSGTLTFTSNQASTKSIALTGEGISIDPVIKIDKTSLNFEDTEVMTESSSLNLVVNGDNLVTGLDLSVTAGFVISLDDNTFTNTLQIPADSANDDTVVYVKFKPTEVASITGVIAFKNAEVDDVEIDLLGYGTAVTYNYKTFNQKAIAHLGGATRTAQGTFNLHTDLSNISKIKMFLQIDCPSSGCDDWDRFANVKVKDVSSGKWYELGRYITPYWTGTQQLARGLEFDVTDFKSLLTGSVDLRIMTDNWTTKADLISVEFDFIEGKPDYPYYAISEVLGFHSNSTGNGAIPYGVSHNRDLDKQISIPSNAESTHLRTVISGWGHATPKDTNGRGCAEWCFRTHHIKINGSNTFEHYMGPIGCASNPVSNQSPGNWTPDRAGWCPGMAVPTRIDVLSSSMAGSNFSFEYDFEDWTNNMGNGDAFYSTSTYVVVKSNSVIVKPTITN